MGDGRTYDHVCALRAVTSTDGMTADFYPFEPAFLGRVATRIINEVRGIIATGQRTGNVATAAEIEAIGAATGLPLLVGSGADKSNIADILKRTNGVIVASSLKQGGVWWNPVDVERVREFRAAAQPALGA